MRFVTRHCHCQLQPQGGVHSLSGCELPELQVHGVLFHLRVLKNGWLHARYNAMHQPGFVRWDAERTIICTKKRGNTDIFVIFTDSLQVSTPAERQALLHIIRRPFYIRICILSIHPRLRYKHFGLWKVISCHIGILLPLSTLTIIVSDMWFCNSLPNFIQIEPRRRSHDIISFLARDAFVRTNRRAIAIMFVRPSVCPCGTACIVIIRCTLARIQIYGWIFQCSGHPDTKVSVTYSQPSFPLPLGREMGYECANYSVISKMVKDRC